jgi:hypothetical protein
MPRIQNTARARATGQAMAQDALKRRRAAMKSRQEALASRPDLAARHQKLSDTAKIRLVRRATSAGVVVAEGDSWFDYPFNDVLKHLEDFYAYDVEAVSHRGDNVEDMAYSDGQLDEFSRRIEKVLRTGVEPKAILLSGGGNDLAGDEFAVILNHASSSIPGLNGDIVSGVVERLQDAYVTILTAITAVCQGQIGRAVPIIIHGYDYPVPDGRGVFGGWPFPGPWLEPGFRRKGYEKMTARMPLMIKLIDHFNAMLRRVSRLPTFPHVRYLDLRGTLPTGATYEEWWDNELHPTKRGFRAVTAKFAAAIERR